ncbi:MAG: DUF6441 family protein [Novosphingobium sp.]
MRANITLDHREIEQVERAMASEVLRAGTRTVRAATRRLEKDFEQLTRAAVPGKAWRAWKSEVYPKGDIPAYAPSGDVYVSGGRRSQGMMTYWTQPGVNRAKSGGWLAIPTPAAGALSRGGNLTPDQWERRTGIRLQLVKPGGKYNFLIAAGALSKNNRGILKAYTERRASQGRKKVQAVIFILIPFQPFANRVALQPAIGRARDFMISDFGRRLDRIGV